MTEVVKTYSNRDGFMTTLIVDEDEDKFIIHEQEDIEPILDSVARDREIMAHTGVNKVLGRVPRTVMNRALREQWGEDDWRKWWNGDGRAFRIWKPGGQI